MAVRRFLTRSLHLARRSDCKHKFAQHVRYLKANAGLVHNLLDSSPEAPSRHYQNMYDNLMEMYGVDSERVSASHFVDVSCS